MEWDYHAILYLLLGLCFLGLNGLPRLQERYWRYLPEHAVYVVVGVLLFHTLFAPFNGDPRTDERLAVFTEYITEIIVIIALLTAGISIDRVFSWKGWKIPLRLILVTMPLTMLATGYAAAWMLNLSIVECLLIAACIAPTDPVLATNIQVSGPNKGGESNDRFGLTAEAGLNDGLAFPFVYLAVGIAAKGLNSEVLLNWLAYDVLYRVLVGVGIGAAIGWIVSHYIFKLSRDHEQEENDAGVLVIAAIFLSYGAAELVNGYGFLAVFCAALVGRRRDKDHDYHEKPYQFARQVEQLLQALLLLGLGALIVTYWNEVWRYENLCFALAIIFIIRPVAGYFGLLGMRVEPGHRLALAFFGIRGLGSIYYLAFGQNHIDGGTSSTAWSAVLTTVALSIIIHGVTAAFLPAAEDAKNCNN